METLPLSALCSGIDQDRLKYALACLKQGMTYPAAARASGVNEASLREALPGHATVREAPEVSPLSRCAAVLPEATETECRQVMALAAAIHAERVGVPETLDAFQNAISATPGERAAKRSRFMRISARDVLEHVADVHGLAPHHLLSVRRTRDIARPRQIAMYAIKHLCPHMSYPAVGRMLGGRDHTTILHGVRKIEELIAVDEEIAERVSGVLRFFEERNLGADDLADESLVGHAVQFQAMCAAYARAMGQAHVA